MSYYQDDQERLRRMREAMARGQRPSLTRPSLPAGDPYKHNSYLNAPSSPVQGAEPTGSVTGSLFSKAKDVIGSAPSTKKDYMGNKPGFDFGDITDFAKQGMINMAPPGTGAFVKGLLDPAAAKEGSGLLGLNAKTGANFRAGTGDLIEGTGNIMRWAGDKMENKPLQKAGQRTAEFAEKNFIEDFANPYEKEFKWTSLFDPEWYSTTVARSIPFTLSMIAPGAAGFSIGSKAGMAIANTTKFGNFGKNVIRSVAGGLGGTAATAPFESAFEAANVYKEALGRGMSEEEADAAADSVFKNNLALLGVTNAIELATIFSPFKAGAGLKGAAFNTAKVAGSAIMEGGQEVGQEVFSATALGDELNPAHLKEAFASGAIMGGGMNAFSKLGEADPIEMIRTRVRERLSSEMKETTDSMREEMKESGADPKDIEGAIDDFIAEQPEGQQHINEVTQEIVTKLSEQSDDDIIVNGIKADEEEATEPEETSMNVDEFNPGDIVFLKNISGQFEVVDNSDPSMLTVKNKFGNELKVGRLAVNKDAMRQNLANAMESAVMTTAKEQVETLENAQEPAGEKVAPEQVQSVDLSSRAGIREEMGRLGDLSANENDSKKKQGYDDELTALADQYYESSMQEVEALRPHLSQEEAEVLYDEVSNSGTTDEIDAALAPYEHLLQQAPQAPQTPEQLREEVTQAVNEAVGIQEDEYAQEEETEEETISKPSKNSDGYQEFQRGDTVEFMNDKGEVVTGTVRGHAWNAGTATDRPADNIIIQHETTTKKGKKKTTHTHVKSDRVRRPKGEERAIKDEDFKLPDEYEDYGDESLDDIRAELMEEHQQKNEVEAVEEPKNEVSNVKRPVEGTNEVTVTSKNEMINSLDSAAAEARKEKKFVAFENLHKPEIRALAVEFKQKFPDFYAAEIYKRNSEGENVLSAIKFYAPEMWAGEAKWKQERNWKLQANPGQGRIIISKGEVELVFEVSRSGKEDKDFTDEELFADDSYATPPRKGNFWRWKGNRKNTFDTIVTPTLEGLPQSVVFGQELEFEHAIKLGELRKWFEGKEYERPKPVRKKIEDLPEDYQATHVLEDGRKVAIREVKMEGQVLVVQDEKGIVEKVASDSVQPIQLQLGDGGNQAEILSQFERNDYATIEIDGEEKFVRVLNEKFTINVRLLPLTKEGKAASQKTIILDITDPAILTMKKAERPGKKQQAQAIEEPKEQPKQEQNEQSKETPSEPAAEESPAQPEEQSERTILGYPATMEEGTHTKTGKPIWKVKINAKVSEADLPKVKGLVKKFNGRFYNERYNIKDIAGWNVFSKNPEGIFDHAETKTAEESGAQSQEAAGENFPEILKTPFIPARNGTRPTIVFEHEPPKRLTSYLTKLGFSPEMFENEDEEVEVNKEIWDYGTGLAHAGVSKEQGEKLVNQIKEYVDRIRKEQGLVKEEVAPKKEQNFVEIIANEYEEALNSHIQYLEDFKGKGVEQGGVIKNQEGEVQGRYGRISRNPQWYQEFYSQHGRKPNKGEYRQLAEQHLINGFKDEYGSIEPWYSETVERMEDDVDNLAKLFKADQLQSTREQWQDALKEMHAARKTEKEFVEKKKTELSKPKEEAPKQEKKPKAGTLPDWNEYLDKNGMGRGYKNPVELTVDELWDLVENWSDAYFTSDPEKNRKAYLKYAEKVYNAANKVMDKGFDNWSIKVKDLLEGAATPQENLQGKVPDTWIDEVFNDDRTDLDFEMTEPAAQEAPAKSYNDLVLEFAAKLSKKNVFSGTIKDDDYSPKEIIEMFSNQVRADVSAQMMDYLNEPNFDSDAWNKLTGEVGIRQIINAAILNVQEGETNATTDTVRTDGKKTLAGAQAENVPGTASERNPGSETVRSTGNSEDADRGTDGERNESARSAGNDSAADNPSTAGRSSKRSNAVPGLVNYRLSKQDIIGIKGKKTTAENNLEIIKLAKQIESENRPATEEEKKKLVQFVGWGGLKEALDDEWRVKHEWKPFLNQLKQVLSKEELDSARRSRLFAHYTAVDVIEGMYQGLEHLGFDGGRMLEPAAGIGHFIGMLPDTIIDKSRFTAVEVEPMTALIGRLLYPKSDFRKMGFEKTKIGNDMYDVAIGNVPFNETGVFDKDYKKSLTNSLHNYFFVKSLDKVREGGLVMFITSSWTMDSKSKGYRQYLANRAELVGAIRLPNNAFKENAGTQVTTDIVILKKLPEGQKGNQDWVNTVTQEFPNPDYHKNPQWHSRTVEVEVNAYFAKNPGMVVGEVAVSKDMYGSYQTAAVAKEGIDIKKEVAKRFKKLPKNVYEKPKTNILTEEEIFQLTIPAPDEVKEGAFHFQDNQMYVKNEGNLVPVNLTGTKLERAKGLIKVREAVRELFYAEIKENSKAKKDGARKKLNTVYDAFVKKYGAINSNANVQVFQEDPDFYIMSNIEDYDKDTNKAAKGEIFRNTTVARYEPVEKADNAREALAVSLNETGQVNLARMKELTGQSESAIMEELGDLVFVDPTSHRIQTKEEYLSGNVRVKLQQAETAAELDEQYKKNVDALKEVVPADIPAFMEDGKIGISAPLGSPWLPAEYVKEFIGKHLLEWGNHRMNELDVSYAPTLASWSVSVKGKPTMINSDKAFGTNWGSSFKQNTVIIEAALDNKELRVEYEIEDENGKKKKYVDAKATAAVREKVANIRDEWLKWVWGDENRKNDLVRLYNDKFNSHVLREYDGSHLTFPNMNPEIAKLFRPYQKNAVYRATQGGNTLFAHAVGAGKTFEMIASIMELKRLGLVKKPMWVVPNHLVAQSAREFNLLYPNANILVPKKKDLEAKGRKNLFAKIASRNYDVIIIPHSSFGNLSMSPDNVRRFMQEQIDQLTEAIELEVAAGERSDKRLTKTMENAKIKLENKMEEAVAKLEKDNDTATFEEVGVDAIVVDEAHEFKNLMFSTRRGNVGGLGNPAGSGKAFDLFMKVRYLNELNGGRGIIFATGTPISNSLAEMYHMMRYLAHDVLEELQINNFDAWANLFADIQNVLEMAPEGNGYRTKNKVKGIVNAPELLTQFRAFADVKTTEELLEAGLIKHPKVKREIVEIPENPILKKVVEWLVQRAERVRAKEVDPEEDNMLKITNEGRYAALDVRILDPENQDYLDNKVNYAKAKILDVWKRTKKEKGTQLVFIDLSTPGKESEEEEEAGLKFSVYNDLRNKLIRAGIPKEEIAFIHDAKNDNQKIALFDKVNSGEIRVLIGSSSKMGAGMNVQKRLKALHHIDVPWRPSDIEQREGRILRHGNTFEEVEIYNYVQKGSFDSYMWQLIESKAKIINRVMSGDLTSRTIEDDSEVVLNASKMKAIASGDERVYEYETLKVDVSKLELQQEEHIRQEIENQHKLRFLTEAKDDQGRTRLEAEEDHLAKLQEDQKRVQDLTGDKFTVKIGNQTITKRTDAGKFLFAAINKMKTKALNKPQKVGEFSGFDIMYVREQSTVDSSYYFEDLYLLGNLKYDINIGDETGTIRSMEARLTAFTRLIEQSNEELAGIHKAIAALKAKIGQPFAKTAELQKKKTRRDELQAALSIDENQEEVILEEEVESETKSRRTSSTKAFVVGTDTIAHNMTPKTAKDISDKLANVMNTVLRTGNVKGAAATYTPHRKTGNIKDKYLHNIRITAHEIGHHFEEYGFEGDADELIEVAQRFYPAFENLKKRADKISEGKAELFTLYVLNPESARVLAPITVEEIENVIADNKALNKAFKEIHEMVEKDKNKAVFEKGLGSIALPSEDKKGKTIGDEYYVDNVPESAEGKERIKYEIGGRVKKFLTKFVDYKIPFADLQKERSNQDGKDLVKMLAVTGNSEIMAREAFTGWARDHRGRYIINYRTRSELPDYLMEKYDELNAMNPINAKADTPLIERYKKFFQEHKNKERAILEAISSRSLQEISEDGMYLIQTKIKGHNASDALKEEAERIKKDHKENPEFAYFASIIQAYRAAERYSRTDNEGNQKFTEVFMSQETALGIIEATRANFPGLEELIREYTDNLSNIILTKLVAAGVTTEEARERIEEGSGFYVPTYYAFKNPSLAAEARERKTAGQPIKGFQGKQAEVIDFLRSSIYKLMEVEQSVEFKRVLDEVESALKEEGMGKFGEILPQNRIPQAIQGANIAKQVTEQLQQILGDDAVTIDQIEESIVNNVYTVFFPTDMLKNKAPILMNWHDNKRVYMRLAPDLYNSIRSMQPIHLNAALRVLSRFSSFTRYLAIASPRYLMNVISRDFFSAQIQRNVAQNTIKGFLKGATLAWGKDERLVDQYMTSGSFVSAQENILNSFKRGSVVDGLIDTKVKNWKRTKKNRLMRIINPSEILQWQEQINRYGTWEAKAKELAAEYNIDVKKIFDGREPLTDSEFEKMEKILLELGYEASEVTTNFRGHGTSEAFRNVSAPITFLHGTIQGLYREAREMKTNPGRVTTRITMGILPMSILSWALLQAFDDDADDITSEMKDKYWIFPVGGGYISIAKPFGYALPIAHLERMADHFIAKGLMGKEEARSWYEDFWNPAKHNLMLPFLPIYGTLALELYSNKTWYGGEIEGMGDKGKPTEQRFDADTSVIAKFQADVMYGLTKDIKEFLPFDPVVSPKKFDYAAKQLFGEAGRVTINTVDKIAGKDTPLMKNPFFSEKELMSSRSVGKFYDNLDKMEDEHKRTGEKGKPAPELKRQREAQDYMSLFRKVEDEVKLAESLNGKEKMQYQKKIASAKKDLTRVAAGREPHDRENLMEIVALAERYKQLNKK